MWWHKFIILSFSLKILEVLKTMLFQAHKSGLNRCEIVCSLSFIHLMWMVILLQKYNVFDYRVLPQILLGCWVKCTFPETERIWILRDIWFQGLWLRAYEPIRAGQWYVGWSRSPGTCCRLVVWEVRQLAAVPRSPLPPGTPCTLCFIAILLIKCNCLLVQNIKFHF